MNESPSSCYYPLNWFPWLRCVHASLHNYTLILFVAFRALLFFVPTLVKFPSNCSIYRVGQAAHCVEGHRQLVVAGHEVERDNGQHDTEIT